MRTTIARLGAGLFFIVYMLWFAGGGLWARFTGDDLMNLNFHLAPPFSGLLWSNLTYWSTTYRPMGGVVYALVYHVAGLHSMAFRVVCFALLALNLALVYRLAMRLTGRTEVALVATLLMSYHAWLVNLYYSTGTIYELLCFAFYVAALDYYVSIRRRGEFPAPSQLGMLAALYICALNSKELAVTLPVSLLCYELVWHRPAVRKSGAWLMHEGRAAMVMAVLTVPYLIGKLSGPDSLAANPAYRPAISASRYLHTFHLYLNVLFYQDHFFRDANTIALVVLMLALAIWRRSHALLFAWCFLLYSVLPFIFVPHYSGFFIYLPMVGWTLYAATALVMLRDRIAPRLPGAALCLLVALVLEPVHARESHKTMRVFASADIPTTETIDELRRVQPTLPRGAHVYFVSDPFAPKSYALHFLVRLVYDDLTIEVARAQDGEQTAGRQFDAIFRWEDGRLSVVR